MALTAAIFSSESDPLVAHTFWPRRLARLVAVVAGTVFSIVLFHGDEARAAQVYPGTVPLQPDDVAEAVHWVATLPPRVNVTAIELMPVAQAYAGLSVSRSGS